MLTERIRNTYLGLKAAIALATVAFVGASALAASPPLPAFGADPAQTSVSGLSSGAFMAVQLQVAYSRSIVGSGIVAGGPYYCAANNIAYAAICMGQVPFVPPNPALMLGAARAFASKRLIDPLSYLSKRRIYVFSGTEDTIVRQPVVDATVWFFRKLGVEGDHLLYVNELPAGHALIAPSAGNDCSANSAPYVSHCSVNGSAYDQAGALLQHIYGTLHARVETPAGQIVNFDQRPFAPAATGLADTGYLYVPHSCTMQGTRCKVHVALHGCLQAAESVGDTFYSKTGYNNWADSNDILVLYPQVNKSTHPYNPNGCWDWWGYTGSNYAYRSAPQMKAIKAMVRRLTQQRSTAVVKP
ncbi:MAG TPA: PHB depolymerase family esterase [Burkholderiales bacterium]|nr:PHB depolymerase family esterase [Burkholderiales bacterium]